MDSEKLITEILRLYNEADTVTAAFHCDGISRGRRHTISSMAEDAVACFLYKQLADDSLEVWVDYGLSYDVVGVKNRQVLYPDIAFVRRQGAHIEVLAIVDVKMDMGFKRDEYPGEMEGIALKINNLKAARLVRRKVKNENGWKEGEEVLISPKLLQCFAVLSDQNMGKGDKFLKIRKAVAEQSVLRLYAFTTGKYLGYAKPEEVVPLPGEVEQLVQTLKSQTETQLA